MMKRLLILAPVLAVLAACATTPEEDPVQVKLNDLDARTTRIERVVANNSLVDLAQRTDTLQAQLRALQGKLDVLENENEALRKQQRDLYADLDKRLTALSAAGSATPPGASSNAAPATGDQAAYSQALDLLKSGKYPEAIAMLRQFQMTYPRSNLADNAQYWLGEAYYVSRDFQNAAGAFRTVVDQWPTSRKAPDAMLKLGYSQYELKQYAAARTTLSDVGTHYPGSDAARLAAERLRSMPAQGAAGSGQGPSGSQ
jgi:tol-pal system protein YbgF